VIVTLARPDSYRRTAILAAASLAIGSGLFASAASAQSITDSFKNFFGGIKPAPAEATPQAVPDGAIENCPPVSIRAGASTFAVGAPGKPATGSDLRYQATITRTARDCTKTGDQITARIGIQGRVIAGPAGNPPTVEVPLRVAVVQGGINEKTITTKVFRTTVSMSEAQNVPFDLVAEDVVYPIPPGNTGDSYIFYIGFDPQALTPEPKPKAVKKKPAAAPTPG
jgi:hypothetical protein